MPPPPELPVARVGFPCTIHYHDIGDYLDRKQKLEIIKKFQSLDNVPWQIITPNARHDWINQRGDVYDSFISLGDKKDDETETIFDVYSRGLETTRDAWCYNFSEQKLSANMRRMIDFYNEQVEAYQEKCKAFPNTKVDDFVDTDPTKISWSSSLKSFFTRQIKSEFFKAKKTIAMYRPFCAYNVYFDGHWVHRVGQMPRIFPEPGMENLVICVEAPGGKTDFSVLISNTLPDLHLFGASQCFPLYAYEPVDNVGGRKCGQKRGLFDQQDAAEDAEGERIGNYIRRENIPDKMRDKFRDHYHDPKITKEDIFYYVYGVMHSRSYREQFASDLKKQLPRIPLVDDFWTFSKAGRELGALHVHYEMLEPWPLTEIVKGTVSYRVQKMRFPSQTDKSRIVYNGSLTLDGIPPETYRYVVNGRSALEWIMERYQVTMHKESRIENDPNDWCDEHDDPRYIVDLIRRIVTLSVKSVKIIEELPDLTF